MALTAPLPTGAVRDVTWPYMIPLLFAVAIAANLFALATRTVLPWNADTGLSLVSSSQPFISRADAVTQPALGAGFKPGDLVDARDLARVNGYANPIVGVPYTLVARRGNQTLEREIVPLRGTLAWSSTARFICVLWLLLFTLFIVLRADRSRENALLVLVLLLIAIMSPFFGAASPDTRIDFLYTVINVVGFSAFCFALTAYACLFGRPLSRLRQVLFGLALAGCVTSAATGCAFYSMTTFLWGDPITFGGINAFNLFAMLLIVLIVLASAMVAAPTSERQRLAWVLASFTPYFVGVSAGNFAYGNAEWLAFQRASLLFVPAGLSYAAVTRRMFDFGFVINRAAVFAAVSIIVVGAFVLVEWALGRWFENASHATNLAVNAGLALVLGFSIRFVHNRIDAAVDNVFFRKRHENETALRRFAREAGFFTDAATLIDRARTTILSHSEATRADVVFADEVDLNDAAVIAMRAWHEPVDLTNVNTSLNGDTAFPMLAHGAFVGAIVCGAKNTGERYAPDEVDALRELAHGVGLALDGLERRSAGHDLSLGAALARIEASLEALPAALAERSMQRGLQRTEERS